MPPAPEFAVPAFGIRVPPLLADHQGGLTLQAAEDPGDREFRRDRNRHAHAIETDHCIMDLDAPPTRRACGGSAGLGSPQPEEGLPPIFRRENDVVTAIPASIR